MKAAKRLGLALLAILLFIGVTLAAGLWYIGTPPGRQQLSEFASRKLGREVVFGGEVRPIWHWPPGMRVTQLTVANMEEGRAERMAGIGTLEVTVAPLSLLKGKPFFPSVMLADSEVHLERNDKAQANWAFNPDKPKPPEEDPSDDTLPIGALSLQNARLTYWDAPKNIDIALEGGTQGEDVAVTGSGRYKNGKFSLSAKGGSLLSAQSGESYPVEVDLAIGNTTATARGVVEDPKHFSGLDIDLRIKGADAAELFPLLGIALPPTPPYDVKGRLTYVKDDRIWKFRDFSGTLGDSDLRGNLSWDQSRKRPLLRAEFVSNRLDFKDLKPLIGKAPEPEQAVSARQRQLAAKEDASPYVIPDVPLDPSKLKAMDAQVTFTGKQVISPNLPMDDFYAKVALDDRLLAIEPVKFGTAKGDIVANIRTNGRKEPFDTSVDVTFRKLSLGALLENVGRKIGSEDVAEGYIGGTAKLRGTGKSLRDILSQSNGNVGIGMEGGRLSNLLVELAGLDVAQSLGFFIGGDKQVKVRCVVADFGVENGLMQARTLVADTSDTNIQGEGSVNLKTEGLDLRFVPHPKDTSLMSLRSPITLEGTLKKPDVGIEKAPLAAKGGVAAALSVVLTPLAGLLAFIEPGLGEDSDCAALMKEMNADTGKTRGGSAVPVNH